jgi:hypothetical protein
MLKSLYYSTALALLPSAEALTKQVEKIAYKLDNLTIHFEGYLEEKAVALAKNAQSRRSARDSLINAYGNITAAVGHAIGTMLDTIESAFQRREQRIIADIGALRSKLDAASEARDAVAALIGR